MVTEIVCNLKHSDIIRNEKCKLSQLIIERKVQDETDVTDKKDKTFEGVSLRVHLQSKIRMLRSFYSKENLQHLYNICTTL